MSKFKIGDIVTIIKRTGNENDYPFGFIDIMMNYEGKSIKIIDIIPVDCYNFYNNLQKIRFMNDPFYYLLSERGKYIWHSSMFVNGENKRNLNIF